MLVENLHFQIDTGLAVEENSDVEDESLFIKAPPQNDGIQDLNRDNGVGIQMEERCNQVFLRVFAALQDGAEHVVVGHIVVDSSGGIGKRDICRVDDSILGHKGSFSGVKNRKFNVYTAVLSSDKAPKRDVENKDVLHGE